MLQEELFPPEKCPSFQEGDSMHLTICNLRIRGQLTCLERTSTKEQVVALLDGRVLSALLATVRKSSLSIASACFSDGQSRRSVWSSALPPKSQDEQSLPSSFVSLSVYHRFPLWTQHFPFYLHTKSHNTIQARGQSFKGSDQCIPMFHYFAWFPL